jgi:hypothetical protein
MVQLFMSVEPGRTRARMENSKKVSEPSDKHKSSVRKVSVKQSAFFSCFLIIFLDFYLKQLYCSDIGHAADLAREYPDDADRRG